MPDHDLIPTPDEFEQSKPRKKNFIARLVGRLRVRPDVGEEARRVPAAPPGLESARTPQPHTSELKQAPTPQPPKVAAPSKPARKIVFKEGLVRPQETHRKSEDS